MTLQSITEPVETNRDKFFARKKYRKPEITSEFELETRAGSPLFPGLDLLDADKWDPSDQ